MGSNYYNPIFHTAFEYQGMEGIQKGFQDFEVKPRFNILLNCQFKEDAPFPVKVITENTRRGGKSFAEFSNLREMRGGLTIPGLLELSRVSPNDEKSLFMKIIVDFEASKVLTGAVDPRLFKIPSGMGEIIHDLDIKSKRGNK